jgi:glycosyltransferase involved in cell wall biosynthesis
MTTASSPPRPPGGAHDATIPESVAIVHDYVNQRGGAERVVLELAAMFPGAPIYTSLYRSTSTFPEFEALDVRTTPLHRLPVDAGFRNLFPLYPLAFRSLGALSGDLVISSSSGWAHAVRTREDTFHAVYCHTPARWLYGHPYMAAARRVHLLRPALGALRRWDRIAARRADLYIANGRLVQGRIRDSYGLTAPIVSPPVDTERFTPRPRGSRLLVVSRLLPYKRVDLVVAAATRAGMGLDVVGIGSSLDALRAMAGPTVTFHGALDDAEVTVLMEQCRTFCLPGIDDFGIAPVEAQAAGKPVVAFAGGGALDTVTEGLSGVFFHESTADAVLDAIHRADHVDTSPGELGALASRYSRPVFRKALLDVLDRARDG